MRLLFATIAVSLTLPFAACKDDKDDLETPPVMKPIDRDLGAEMNHRPHHEADDRAAGDDRQYMHDVDTAAREEEAERQGFIDDAEDRLEAIGSKLEQMADTTQEEMSAAQRTARDELRQARNELAAQLRQARMQADDDWKATKSGIMESLSGLERTYNELLERAKSE